MKLYNIPIALRVLDALLFNSVQNIKPKSQNTYFCTNDWGNVPKIVSQHFIIQNLIDTYSDVMLWSILVTRPIKTNVINFQHQR